MRDSRIYPAADDGVVPANTLGLYSPFCSYYLLPAKLFFGQSKSEPYVLNDNLVLTFGLIPFTLHCVVKVYHSFTHSLTYLLGPDFKERYSHKASPKNSELVLSRRPILKTAGTSIVATLSHLLQKQETLTGIQHTPITISLRLQASAEGFLDALRLSPKGA